MHQGSPGQQLGLAPVVGGFVVIIVAFGDGGIGCLFVFQLVYLTF